MKSIRQRLRLEVLVVGMALATAGSLVTGWKVSQEVSDLLDYPLEQVARSLIAHDLTLRPDDRPEDLDRHLIIRIVGPEGETVYLSHPDLELPQSTPDGFTSVVTARDGLLREGLRIYTLQGPRNRIQVMQSLALRRSLHLDVMWRSLWPALAAIVALSVWTGVALRRALRPLDTLSEALRRREPATLEPIELLPCPDELRAPVESLNALLRRLESALLAQRRFTGDAAHELRTPLAALRLQAQNLAQASDAASRAALEQALLAGIDRCTHLITQLLALARQDEQALSPPAPLSLRSVAREALIECAASAAEAGVELALEDGPDATVVGHAGDLQRLVGNLLNNAVRHTAEGGSVGVEVQVGPEGATLCVNDEGPGMTRAERDRAFDRFYRGDHALPGSGLGLAIARQIALRHGAEVSLHDNPAGRGLSARLHFPAR